MSPFGLFDLLKTLLPATDQTPQPPSTPPSSAPSNGTEFNSESAPNNSPAQAETPVPQPIKPNACADFLYQHERRSKSVKDAKKRLD